MTLKKQSLKQDLYELFTSLIDDSLPAADKRKAKSSMQAIAEGFADAIDAYIKEATVETDVKIKNTSAEGSISTGTGTGKIS